MDSYEELIDALEGFRSDKRNELPLAPIEKWMVSKLGVKCLKNKGGSILRYHHTLFGNFLVHRIHGGKENIKIYRKNFLNITCKHLKQIIEQMRSEGQCE